MEAAMIPVAEPSLSEKELEYVTDCLKSGWISSLGKYVPLFEQKFSQYCGVKYGIATSNGTTALHLALVTLGIGPGDEVIVPTLTFIATANAVTYTGARPVFVDAEPVTWNLDPAKIAEKITPHTRAIIPVHLYGHPANMDAIREIAHSYGLFVIEDAAEAHGAEYKGQKVGSLGDIACFSFSGNKIITTGEGGALLSNNHYWVERARLLRDHAMSRDRRYWHTEVGYNYHLTNVQAAIGVAQLERIDEFIARKRANARMYNSLLEKVAGLTLPPEEPWAKSVYCMYSILLEDSYGISRDQLMLRLRKAGIDSRPFFHPMHTLPPYKSHDRLPVAESLAAKGINLPSAVKLSADEISRVAGIVAEAPQVVVARARRPTPPCRSPGAAPDACLP
jgi:perosamine synthetase